MPGVNMPQSDGSKTSLADIASIVKMAYDMKGTGAKQPPKQQPTGLVAQNDPSLGGAGGITPTGQSDAMDRRLKASQYGVA